MELLNYKNLILKPMKKIIAWILISISLIPLIIGLGAVYITINMSITGNMIGENQAIMSISSMVAMAAIILFLILLQIGLVLKRKK